MKTYYLCLVILSVWLLPARGQTDRQRDSLWNLVRTARQDTARVLALKDLGRLVALTDLDSAAQLYHRGLDLARRIGFEKGEAQCLINLSFVSNETSEFGRGVSFAEAAIPICEKLGLYRELAAAYNNLANAWNAQGNAWLALSSFEKSLAAMERAVVPPFFPVAVKNNLAMVCNDLRLYEKGLQYSREVIRQAEEIGDSLTLGIAYQNAANAYESMERREEALPYYQQAAEMGRRLGHVHLEATSLGCIAEIVNYEGRWEQAQQLYEQAIQLGWAHEDWSSLAYNLHGLSLVHFDRGRYIDARREALQALELARRTNLRQYIFAIYLTLSDIALAEGDQEAWTTYRELYTRTRDSVANTALVHALQELETKYETQQKDRRIGELQYQSEIQQLQLQRKNGLIGGAMAVTGLLLVAGMLGWRNQQHRRRLQNQEIALQQQQLRELEQEKQLSVADALLQGQERERSRLARDLHDGLGGLLSGVKQTLFAMKGDQILPESSALALNQVIRDLDHSISELRHIARNMMPEALVRFGLRDALQDYCDHIQQSTGLKVHFQAFNLAERLPQSVEVVLFRVAQELLNNIVKHAQANRVLVQLLRDDNRLTLTVEDDGRGFDAEQLQRAPGVGWLNIRSRIDYLNGQLDLHTQPGRGASVTIECLVV